MAGLQILLFASAEARSSVLADLLRSGGHHVVVELDQAAAARALREDQPDTLVLDLRSTAGPDLETLAAALAPSPAAAPPVTLEAVERAQILVGLRHTRGNKRRAAQLLGIARSTLIQKVRRYQIQPAELGLADLADD
jgi:DNA-binding NtrC family response regulator